MSSKKNLSRNFLIIDSTSTYNTINIGPIDDVISQQQHQDQQPDSSSELPLFTMIQSDTRPTTVGLKNDTNNNNERNTNSNGIKKLDNLVVSTSKMPLDGISNIAIDDESNNNHKRQVVNLNNIQRYQLDGAESPQSLHTSDPHHHHHLFLMQQQQQQNQQMNHHHHHHLHHQNHHQTPIDKQQDSTSLIVLQPSTQPPSGSVTYSSILSGFNHFATAAGKSTNNHPHTHTHSHLKIPPPPRILAIN